MKKRVALILCFYLVGCAGAQLVKTTIYPIGGTMQYKNGYYVHDKSRKMALDQMSEFCKGPYKIKSEEFNPDVLSINVNGTYFTPGDGNYMYINFVCEK